TGDINAMWLRDSGAQVWPYLPLCKKDEQLRLLIAGVINRQTRCILLDRYANAFTHGAESSEWKSDLTEMKPYIHERKWEVDSLCYPVRLAYNYWKTTGDTSVFDKEWQRAARLIYQTFTEQQRKKDKGPYRFQRRTERKSDTLTCDGWGQPVKPVGMIVSCFRPSDDSTDLGFLVPSNLFAVASLRQLAEIWERVVGEREAARQCRGLADEVERAVRKYAVANHPRHGKVYAFEADGFGNTLFMDDANVPSLLALPYLGCVSENDEVYKNTRRMVWSDSNPYFFKGSAGEGIGGPHIGYDMVWPMSLIMKAITSKDDAEVRMCVRMLRDTDGNTGFMHESFYKDNASKFTRHWFAWANTLFGELILKLVNEGKVGLLNSL
ncbi:MAG: glycoside hydrolase family 125 protein, partial [Odoribacter sp.]|nr:glycoside hydrolase family 125 protein [Odoribacter sp.]